MKKISEIILFLLFLVTIIFHLSVLSGLIPYDIVWGSRLNSKSEMIQLELVSITIKFLFLFVLAIRLQWIPIKLPKPLVNGFLWFMVGLFLLNTVGNLLSESRLEMLIFTPLTLLISLLLLFSLLAKKPKKNSSE
ncbi:MAG: hypothetical protein JXR34_09790 [Bacteroidales bacterium]|nr:hypothetical protein [Bacteroidales bacterium]